MNVGRSLGAAIALAVATGCSDPEPVNPIPVDGGDAGVKTPDAGPFVRTVTMRSPYGSAPKNLLADGDFEWSLAGDTGSQFAWLSYAADGSGAVVSRIETGGLCKSGLRCAVLDRATAMLLRGASAPNGKAMSASIAVKPPAGKGCQLVRVLALPCDTLSTPVHPLTAAKAPDTDGYCISSATLPPSSSSTCLYLDVPIGFEADDRALVDDAKLLPIEGETPLSTAVFVADAALDARLARLRTLIRDHTPVGRMPPRPKMLGP